MARQAVQAFAERMLRTEIQAGAECVLGLVLVAAGRAREGREVLAAALPRHRGWGLADPALLRAAEAALVR